MSSNTIQNTPSSASGGRRRSGFNVQAYREGATRSSARSSTVASTGATQARMAKRVAETQFQTSQVPEPPRRMLPWPLNRFDIEQPPTHVTWDEYHGEKELCGWSYSVGLEVEIGDATWVQITVTVPSGIKGYLLMPPRFYGLWRRLLWGALFFENIWGIWEDMATDVATDAFLREHEETIQHGRRASAMRLMWYMHCRRRIVYELLKTDYDAWSDDMPNPYEGFNAFIEFGIREYRSWMFDTFERAQEEEEHFLGLDPTAPENLDAFSTSLLPYHSSLTCSSSIIYNRRSW